MRKNLIITLALFAFQISIAQGVKFEKSNFSVVKAKATKENKLIFIDFYTTWCVPCKTMDKEIFPQKIVGDYFNPKFVSIKMDAEREGAKKAKQYNVTGFPTLLVIDTKGNEVARMTGAAPDATFFVDYFKQKLGESEKFDFEGLYTQYENGDKSDKVYRTLLDKGTLYAETLSEEKSEATYNKLSKLSKEYFTSKAPKDFMNVKDFSVITDYLGGPSNGHPIVEYIYDNYDALREKLPVADLYTFVVSTNNQSIQNASTNGKTVFRTYLKNINGRLKTAYTTDDKAFEQEEYKGAGIGDYYKEMEIVGESNFAMAKGDYDKFLKLNEEYNTLATKHRDLTPDDYIGNIANLLTYVNYYNGKPLNNNQIQKCKNILQQGLNKFPKHYELNDKMGDLLVIEGSKKEAIISYKKAIKIIKSQGGDSDYFVEEINKKIIALK